MSLSLKLLLSSLSLSESLNLFGEAAAVVALVTANEVLACACIGCCSCSSSYENLLEKSWKFMRKFRLNIV